MKIRSCFLKDQYLFNSNIKDFYFVLGQQLPHEPPQDWSSTFMIQVKGSLKKADNCGNINHIYVDVTYDESSSEINTVLYNYLNCFDACCELP